MVTKSNEEYLYQTPEDCFPEAELIQENVDLILSYVRWLPSSLIIRALTGKQEKSSKIIYQFAEILAEKTLTKTKLPITA